MELLIFVINMDPGYEAIRQEGLRTEVRRMVILLLVTDQ